MYLGLPEEAASIVGLRLMITIGSPRLALNAAGGPRLRRYGAAKLKGFPAQTF